MTAAAKKNGVEGLIDALSARGVCFSCEGGDLLVSAPKGLLSAEDASLIRARKAEIMERLGGASTPAANGFTPAGQPLGYLQERIWSHQQMFPELPLYNLAMAWRLNGALDKGAIDRAFSAVLARHEILRSRFSVMDGAPIVSFAEPEPVVIDEEAVSDADALTERLAVLRDAPIGLNQGETYHVRLLRISYNEHVLFFMPHHIVWDGLSWDVFLRDLAAFYEQETGGASADLPALNLQYADFAAFQRALLATPALDAELDHWRNYYSADTPPLALPSDVKRPKLFSYEGDAIAFPVPKEVFAGVKRLAGEHQCTSFVVYLAAWQAFLARYTGQSEIIVGAPAEGRHEDGFINLVGCFGNVLAPRQHVDENLSFSEFLSQSRAEFLDVFQRQRAPMELIATRLSTSRDISRTAIFQAMFTHQDESERTKALGDLDVEMINIAPGGAPTDIRLEIIDGVEGAVGEINYAHAALSSAAAADMTRAFEIFLSDAIAYPEKRVGDLALMDDEIRRRVIVDWNDTKKDYCREALSFDYFDRIANARPDAPAVSMGERQCTYGALQAHANRIGNSLQAKGIGPGDIVAIHLARSIDIVAVMLGVWKAGAAMLPIDPAFPAKRLAYMIEDSRAKAVITTSNLVDDWLRASPAMLIDMTAEKGAIDAAPDTPPVIETRDSASRAYVIYTSGSTGNPKGVENTHRAHCNFIEAMAHEPGISADDRLLAVTTVSFDVMLLELFVPLSVGAEVILASDDEAMDGFALAEIIEQRAVTILQGTPATWRILFDADWKGAPNLKGLCGGEAMPAHIAERLPGMIGALWNMYGPTETTVWSSCARIESADNIHVGKPIANTQIYVLDADGKAVPPGVAGDLWIGGDGVSIGYLGMPEMTAERFKTNPFDPSLGRIYNTGDRARWRRDGVIEIAGRADEQVKIRGYRIELGDIEAALAKHAVIRNAAVAVRNDPSGEPSLVAYVVFKDGQSATNSELRKFIREFVPAYMVPQFFTPLAAMPLTANNKIDRKALPAPAGAVAAARRAPPRNTAEQALAAIWADVLKIEEISVTDNFFELGGQSLQAARMIARAREQLGIRIAPRAAIFENLEQLAAAGNAA